MPVEWASSSLAFPFSDHNNRCCQKRGMSGIMQQTHNSGQVDSRRGFFPHKHFRAVLFALKSFAKVYQMTNARVRFKIDNIPAQAYINHQGGTKFVGLCNQAQEL